MSDATPSLAEIIARKRKQIAQRKVVTSLTELRALAGMTDFRPHDVASVLREQGVTLIGRVCRPHTTGSLPYDPVALARQLVKQGAQVLVVATDELDGGGVEHVTLIKRAVEVPVIRQDYVVDDYQVVETRGAGGDGLLLMANLLEPVVLRGLISLTQRNLLTEIVQVHSAAELAVVLPFEPRVIAICNHDPRSGQTDLSLTAELLARIPAHITAISMCGLETVADVVAVLNGPNGVLLGPELLLDPPTMQAVTGLLNQTGAAAPPDGHDPA